MSREYLRIYCNKMSKLEIEDSRRQCKKQSYAQFSNITLYHLFIIVYSIHKSKQVFDLVQCWYVKFSYALSIMGHRYRLLELKQLYPHFKMKYVDIPTRN